MENEKDTAPNQSIGTRYQRTMVSGPLAHPAPVQGSGASIPSGLLCLPMKVGQYVLTQLLGRGGMSLTFLAHRDREEHAGRHVVIKIPLFDDASTHQRFREEIHLLRALTHEGIVKILAAGDSDFRFEGEEKPRRRPWFAMQYIGGQSLRQRLTTEGPLSWEAVKRLLQDVLQTLQYLHEQKICHRDVKPDNLIYDVQSERWVLVDFGISKSLIRNTHLTITSAQHDPGSWDYMSPEQQNGQPVDSRSDIYSLGKTAWEALIGEVPRVGTPYPGEMPDLQVPPEVDLLLRRMVAHTPDKRFQAPQEVAQTLDTGIDKRERSTRRRKTLRRWLRRAAMIFLPLALLSSGWFIGDFVCTRQAEELVLEHRGSPTRTIHKLEQFANSHRFWGRAFVAEKLAELKPLADEERKLMIVEQKTLLREIADNTQEESYYLIRCRNFSKIYSEIFGDNPEYQAVKAEEERFASLVLAREETTQAEEAIAETRQLEKQEKLKSALDLCKTSQGKFTTKAAQQLMEKREREIRDQYYVTFLKKIDAQLNPADADSLVQASVGVEALEKTFGPSPETIRRLKEHDAKLWSLCQNQVETEKEGNRFQAAHAKVQFYLVNSRQKLHTLDASKLQARIEDAKEDHDWNALRQSIDNNIAANAYGRAMQDAQKYLDKYPQGRYRTTATSRLSHIVVAHGNYVHGLANLDDFNEQLKTFLHLHPNAFDQRFRLKNRLCRLTHAAVSSTMSDFNLTSDAKRNRLKQFDFKLCEEYQKQYLRGLSKVAEDYLNNPTTQWYWCYEHWIQRPPQEVNESRAAPSVFLVRVTSVQINMSNADYAKLQGFNNADPRIDIGYGTGRAGTYKSSGILSNNVGPINQQFLP